MNPINFSWKLLWITAAVMLFGTAHCDFQLSPDTYDQLTVVQFPGPATPNNLHMAYVSEYFHLRAVWTTNSTSLLANNGVFSTNFTFLLTGPPPVADGLAFVIHNSGNNVIGNPGNSLGYDTIKPSVTIKFDVYYNQDSAEPGPEFMAIYLNGSSYYPDALASVLYQISGQLQVCSIDYNGTHLEVWMNQVLVMSFETVMSDLVDLSNVYLGFTAGSGADTEDCTISNWTLSTGASEFTFIGDSADPAGLTQIPAVPPTCGSYENGTGLHLSCGVDATTNLAAWITQKQQALSGFYCEFNYSVSTVANITEEGPGFQFVLQNAGFPYKTNGLEQAYVLYFDPNQDTTTPFIVEDVYNRDEWMGSYSYTTATVDGNHTVVIVYSDHILNVYFNGENLFSTSIDLSQFFVLDESVPIWAGFITGTSAGVSENLIISGWNFIAPYVPSVAVTLRPKPTQPPTTQPPTTQPSTTQLPTTQPPTTQLPTIKSTVKTPTTRGPSTSKPTTAKPTTTKPTTAKPTTAAPTTHKVTTAKPTTRAPTTRIPTTHKPAATVPACPTGKPAASCPTGHTKCCGTCIDPKVYRCCLNKSIKFIRNTC